MGRPAMIDEHHAMTEEVVVTLERCLFDSPSDRPFSVWLVSTQDDVFRATAELSGESWGNAGDTVRLVGRWVEDPRYGRQFRAASVLPYIPHGASGMIRWLAEQRGIGKITAAKVVAAVGTTAEDLERVEEDPSLLETIGLSAPQRQAVLEAIRRYREDRAKNDVLEWCFRVGLGPAQAEAVYDRFEDKAIEVLSEDPWALTAVKGFGFLTADGVAQRLGVNPASPSRMRAALLYVLDLAADEGHVFLPKDEWLGRALEVLAETAQKDGYGRGQEPTIRKALPVAAQHMLREETHRRNPVVIERGGRVYRYSLWSAERTVQRWVESRRRARGVLMLGEAAKLALDPAIRGRLDEVQVGAVVMTLIRGASVLTGGPGTGKSTTTKAVVEAFRRIHGEKFQPLLCAPTGRAAKRLAEVTGLEAKTIHRLLEYHPDLGFRRNAQQTLEGTVLIADEMSMADLPLFAALTAAIPKDMPVLLVGDADQLPPVGPGAPFHEIVRKGLLPITRLERIYRQDAGGPIALAARSINEGQVPPLKDDAQGRYRVKVFPRAPFSLSKAEREQKGRETREQMADAVVGAVRRLILEGWRADDIQVLTPIKRGPLGTQALNERLRPILNGSVRDPQRDVFRTAGGREIWLGDRVIQTVNDYELGVFNGEIGKVVEVNIPVTVPGLGERQGIAVEFEDGSGTKVVEYWAGNVSDLQLAYAATVHKAQGSEFPAVIFVLAWDAYMLLTRPLAYTGVSRARELLWMFLEDGALKQAVDTVRDVARNQDIAGDGCGGWWAEDV